MAATTSERVIIMKQNFMMWHNKGYTIPEIAKKYDVSFGTVYNHLQEIADENNTTRDELLKLVRTVKGERKWEQEARKGQIDVNKMQEDFEDSIQAIDKILNTIDGILKEEEE